MNEFHIKEAENNLLYIISLFDQPFYFNEFHNTGLVQHRYNI